MKVQTLDLGRLALINWHCLVTVKMTLSRGLFLSRLVELGWHWSSLRVEKLPQYWLKHTTYGSGESMLFMLGRQAPVNIIIFFTIIFTDRLTFMLLSFILLGFVPRHPTRLPQLCGRHITSVACGAHHSVALSAQGQVWVWGQGESIVNVYIHHPFLNSFYSMALHSQYTFSF